MLCTWFFTVVTAIESCATISLFEWPCSSDPERIDVRLGEPFAVVLSDNGPGGYLWRVADLPAALRLRREDNLGPGEGAPGATGEKVFELEALEPGTFTVRFERRRDWEPGADRERAAVVNVASV